MHTFITTKFYIMRNIIRFCIASCLLLIAIGTTPKAVYACPAIEFSMSGVGNCSLNPTWGVHITNNSCLQQSCDGQGFWRVNVYENGVFRYREESVTNVITFKPCSFVRGVGCVDIVVEVSWVCDDSVISTSSTEGVFCVN